MLSFPNLIPQTLTHWLTPPTHSITPLNHSTHSPNHSPHWITLTHSLLLLLTPPNHSTQSPTHLIAHSLTQSPTDSIHLLNQSINHSTDSPHWLTHSLTRSLAHSVTLSPRPTVANSCANQCEWHRLRMEAIFAIKFWVRTSSTSLLNQNDVIRWLFANQTRIKHKLIWCSEMQWDARRWRRDTIRSSTVVMENQYDCATM